mmetsp:Transcript_98290/g.275177  ORF Transcript_98290/g.275177 Transcript_98290/m.275177 type:complete len:313 (-) Transcript_98290:541-1479(-)
MPTSPSPSTLGMMMGTSPASPPSKRTSTVPLPSGSRPAAASFKAKLAKLSMLDNPCFKWITGGVGKTSSSTVSGVTPMAAPSPPASVRLHSSAHDAPKSMLNVASGVGDSRMTSSSALTPMSVLPPPLLSARCQASAQDTPSKLHCLSGFGGPALPAMRASAASMANAVTRIRKPGTSGRSVVPACSASGAKGPCRDLCTRRCSTTARLRARQFRIWYRVMPSSTLPSSPAMHRFAKRAMKRLARGRSIVAVKESWGTTAIIAFSVGMSRCAWQSADIGCPTCRHQNPATNSMHGAIASSSSEWAMPRQPWR